MYHVIDLLVFFWMHAVKLKNKHRKSLGYEVLFVEDDKIKQSCVCCLSFLGERLKIRGDEDLSITVLVLCEIIRH